MEHPPHQALASTLEQARRRGRLLRQALPGVMKAFSEVHRAVMTEGALGVLHKELIALALGIGARCEGCILHHLRAALEAGASREQILEAIGVAVLMGGGPATVYGGRAVELLEQLLAEGTPPAGTQGAREL
ncbi:MAG: alkyl hydroperoxide reductase AhpD [Planctomycetota bacterium]|nr:MAG: alkyl hydroperoxide reductase AhpD [Planctomycetota bacterium]